MKYYILFGPPGAGKGTQAGAIAQQYNLKHISTGELLRNEIAAGTELGKKAKEIIAAGNFVGDDVVEGMLVNIFDSTKNVAGFLLDGFPRNISQAQDLDDILSERGEKVNAVISIMIKDETIRERLKHRAEIEGRADDANDETITNRIAQYHKKTEPLIEYYRCEGKYNEVDGEAGDIAAVRDQLMDLFLNGIDNTHLSGRTIFDAAMLDELIRRSHDSARLRMNYDLRNNPQDNSTRMLNVMLPGTKTPIHRHIKSNETVVIIKGSMDLVFYTPEGVESTRYHMGGDSDIWGLSVPEGKYHTIEIHEPTVMLIARDGSYEPITPKDIIAKKI